MKKIFIIIMIMSIHYLSFAQDICGEVKNAQGCSSNGSINLSLKGGFKPYEFQWSNGATTEDIENLAAGNYSVVVTDALCGKATLNFTVAKDASKTSIKLKDKHNVVSCENTKGVAQYKDGFIEVAVEGNSSDYTFTWKNDADPAQSFPNSPKITDIGVGGYTVTVKKNGSSCEEKLNFYLCCCFKKMVEPKDPKGPNDPKVPDEYSEKNGCQFDGDEIKITLVATPPSSGNNDGAITADVSGGSFSGVLFNWTGPNGFTSNNKNISGLRPGTYCLTIKDGCSQKTKCKVIRVCEEKPVTGSFESIRPCPSQFTLHGEKRPKAYGSVTAMGSNGEAPYTYKWGNGSTDQTIKDLEPGTYKVTVTDASDCTVELSFTLGSGSAKDIPFTTETECKIDYECDGRPVHTQIGVKDCGPISQNHDPKDCEYILCKCDITGKPMGRKHVGFKDKYFDVFTKDCTLWGLCWDGRSKSLGAFGPFEEIATACPTCSSCVKTTLCKALTEFGTKTKVLKTTKAETELRNYKFWSNDNCTMDEFCGTQYLRTVKVQCWAEPPPIPPIIVNTNITLGDFALNQLKQEGNSEDIFLVLMEAERETTLTEYNNLIYKKQNDTSNPHVYLKELILDGYEETACENIRCDFGIGAKSTGSEIIAKSQSISNFSVFPNPAQDLIQVSIPKHIKSKLHLEMMNGMGQIIIVQECDNLAQCDINMQNIPSGTYSIIIKDNTGAQVFKTIIVKI
jgi:hypothetical protein